MLAKKHFLLLLAAAFWVNAAAPLLNPTDVEANYQRMLEHCRTAPCPDLAVLLNNFGSLYYSQGRAQQAEPLLREAVSLYSASQEQSVPSAVALANLAAVYRMLARLPQAAPLYDRAIDILERQEHQGAELPRVLARAALLSHDLGDSARGEAQARRAIDLLEALGAADSADTAAARNTLGVILEGQARTSEAQQELKTALGLREKWLGPRHVSVGETLNKLALSYRQQGRLIEAEKLYRRALDILRTNPTSSELGAAHNNLGNALAAGGHLNEAEHELNEAISAWQKLYGADHPNIAAAISNLSTLERSRHHYAEAEKLLARALEMDQRLLPQGHVRIGLDLNNAGTLAAERKRYAEAEDLFRRSLAILENGLPVNHPDTGRVLANLADVLRLERRTEESDERYRQGLGILTKAWGPDDQRLLAWLESYAGLLRSQENFADAAKLDMQAMRIRVRASR